MGLVKRKNMNKPVKVKGFVAVDSCGDKTDAFIEKAIGWIDYNNRNGGCNFDGWEKDFKNYMKGK